VPIGVLLSIDVVELRELDGRRVIEGVMRLLEGGSSLATGNAQYVPRDLETHLNRFVDWIGRERGVSEKGGDANPAER
jgi:hypothetical protein